MPGKPGMSAGGRSHAGAAATYMLSCGTTAAGSSSIPARSSARPGSAEGCVHSVVAQTGQNVLRMLPPLSAGLVKSYVAPDDCSVASGTATAVMCPAPLSLRQSAQ